ncbi:MAG: ATP-binding cassette domain-containing protein [Acidimicrobiales bacterium]|jgi:energy-coupling factor transport system ATP-binding protein
MISFDRVTVTYPGASAPTLESVSLAVEEGLLALVIGETGAGKSTLLRCVNGLVPHFSGGHLNGTVSVNGRSTAQYRPRDLADTIGYVGQDPDATFVAETVEDELAYAMENLGVDPATMRRRVEEVLDTLNLHALRGRVITTLSSGQRQRVAIGAAFTAAPRVLVLDEPTSSLDPVSAEEVLASLARLVHDQGTTILVAEHRLERMVHFADIVVELGDAPGDVRSGTPAAIFATARLAPPVVRLARLAGWEPVPLSVRDARRRAPGLRHHLSSLSRPAVSASPGRHVARVKGLNARYGQIPALSEVTLDFEEGQVTAIMGRNGAGKSTLLHHLVGLRRAQRGSVDVLGRTPAALPAPEAIRLVGLVPQDPSALLCAESVAAECHDGDRDAGLADGTTRAVLDSLVDGIADVTHPKDLSEGQRLALALALVLAPAPPLVLLDEPTRGLDYGAKERLARHLRRLAADGHCVVVATHDVELVAEVADRVVVLADGEVITDGPTRSVVCHSAGLASQVARILAPAEWLTLEEVTAALGGSAWGNGPIQ